MPFPTRSEKKLGELLVELGLVSPVQIHRLLKRQAAMKKTKGYKLRLGEILLREKMLDDTALAKGLAAQWGVDFLDLSSVDVSLDEMAAVPFDIVKRVPFVVIKRGAVDLTLAVCEEPDEELYKVVNSANSGDIFFCMSPRSQVEKLHKHVLALWEKGKRLEGTLNLGELDGRGNGGAGVALQRAVAAVPDDEPLVGAPRLTGQRVFKAQETVSIGGLDGGGPAPGEGAVIEADGLDLTEGDPLDAVLPRLRSAGTANEAESGEDSPTVPGVAGNDGLSSDPLSEPVGPPPRQSPAIAPQEVAIPDPLSMIPDEIAFADTPDGEGMEDFSHAEILNEIEPVAPGTGGGEPLGEPSPPEQAGTGLTPIPLTPVPPSAPVDSAQAAEAPPAAPDTSDGTGVTAEDMMKDAAPTGSPGGNREEVKAPMAESAQPPQKPGGSRKMNARLKELLLQAVNNHNLGLSFIQTGTDVSVLASGLDGTEKIGSLEPSEFGEIVLYLGDILKTDLTRLEQALRRKVKLKIGSEAHLFQFLFAPTRPISLNINILDEDLVRRSLDSWGLEHDVLDKLKTGLTGDHGLTVLSAQDPAEIDDFYYGVLHYLARNRRKVVSFEREIRHDIAGVARYAVGGENGVPPSTVFSPRSLRTFLDAGYENIACSTELPPENLKTIVNLALSERNTILCVPAKDCLSSFMAVKKTGISTSSLIEACRFLVNLRRVRRVCPFCKETFIITREMLPPPLQNSRQLLDVKAYRGTGCAECKNTGIGGTTYIFETMEVDSARINIDELTRTKKPLKTHLLETGLLKPLVRRARSALLSGRITLKEFLEIISKL